MGDKTKNLISYAMFAAVALIWGLSFMVTKEALDQLDTIEVLAVRWGISMLLFVILIALRVVKVRFRGKNVKLLLFLILCQPCLYTVLECTGIDRTTATESSIMIAAIPIMVVLESIIFLKKAPGRILILGVIVGFTGVVMCILPGASSSGSSELVGYLCLLGAITVGGGYNIMTGILSKDFSIMEISCAMAFAGGISMNVLSLMMGYGTHPYRVFLSGGSVMFQLLFLGLGCGVACYAMYNYNLGRFPSTAASCIQTNSINIVGVLAGIIVLNEPWGWYTVIGLTLTIIGIVICAVFSAKSDNEGQELKA